MLVESWVRDGINFDDFVAQRDRSLIYAQVNFYIHFFVEFLIFMFVMSDIGHDCSINH